MTQIKRSLSFLAVIKWVKQVIGNIWQYKAIIKVWFHFWMQLYILQAYHIYIYTHTHTHTHTLRGFPGGSAGKESACSARDLGLILGLGRSPGERKGYPLQYSGLENSMECIVHGVSKSRTQLCDFHLYIKNVYICILYRARYFCLPHQTHVIHISTSRTWFSASCFLTYLNGLTSSLVL